MTGTGVAEATMTFVFTGGAFLSSCSLGFLLNGLRREMKLRLAGSGFTLESDGDTIGILGRVGDELFRGAGTGGAAGWALRSWAGLMTRSLVTAVAGISTGRKAGLAGIRGTSVGEEGRTATRTGLVTGGGIVGGRTTVGMTGTAGLVRAS